MSMEDNFETLFDKDDSVNAEKIIQSFYESKNINMKTELPKDSVMLIAVLEAYSIELKKIGLSRTAKLIDSILLGLKEMMVSANREGRKEATSMLGALREQLKGGGVLSKIFGAEKG